MEPHQINVLIFAIIGFLILILVAALLYLKEKNDELKRRIESLEQKS
jgi:hypothetical protein